MQFLLVGLLLLSTRQLIAPVNAGNASADQILVTEQAVATIKATFTTNQQRQPTDAELEHILNRHIDEEVLYREALRLNLHEHDPIVRRQLQQKMRFLIEDVEALPEPSRVELQAWLDKHPARYAKPQKISFEQVFLSRARHGRNIESAAVEALQRLSEDPDSYSELGDPVSTGRVIQDADSLFVEKHFGGEFAQSVFQQTQGVWSLPLKSSLGLHIVRLTALQLDALASVEEAGSRLIADFKIHQREQANRRAIARLRERYEIQIEPTS